jgi:hypothetical protein
MGLELNLAGPSIWPRVLLGPLVPTELLAMPDLLAPQVLLGLVLLDLRALLVRLALLEPLARQSRFLFRLQMGEQQQRGLKLLFRA